VHVFGEVSQVNYGANSGVGGSISHKLEGSLHVLSQKVGTVLLLVEAE